MCLTPPRTGACIQFPWGGCGGNANNFLSLSECEATCSRQAIEVKPDQAVMKAFPIVQVAHFLARDPVEHLVQCCYIKHQ